MDRVDQLRRAISLGDELLRLTDAMPASMAGPYISLGVEILREQLHGQDPISKLQDIVVTTRTPEA